MQPEFILKQDEFIRNLKYDFHSPYAMLIGAGASVSSGVPSAKECIWQWKKEIYLSNNIDKTKEVNDISLPQIKNRIQSWIDSQVGYPENNSAEEYSFYIEQNLKIPDVRNKFFQTYITKAQPNIGYKLLSIMLESSLINSLWTTNFDDLPDKAFMSLPEREKDLIKISHMNNDVISKQLTTNQILYVLLHGDYKFDKIQNTDNELQNLEKEYVQSLKEKLKNTNLIISGYSGRDDSIMGALEEVYSSDGDGKLFWCGYGDNDYNDRILNLFNIAKENNRQVFYIPPTNTMIVWMLFLRQSIRM